MLKTVVKGIVAIVVLMYLLGVVGKMDMENKQIEYEGIYGVTAEAETVIEVV